jgi:hypothetical protein
MWDLIGGYGIPHNVAIMLPYIERFKNKIFWLYILPPQDDSDEAIQYSSVWQVKLLCTCHEIKIVVIWLYSFLTLALDGGWMVNFMPNQLPPGKQPWVGPRYSLDILGVKIISSPWITPSVAQSLYWLNYPSPNPAGVNIAVCPLPWLISHSILFVNMVCAPVSPQD